MVEFKDKIFYGNNIETIKNLPDNSIDLVVTSPPYDNLRTYCGKLDKSKTYEGGYSFPFQEIAREIKRVLKEGGVCVWVVGDETVKGFDGGTTESGSSFRQALYFQQIGLNIFDTMIYKKNGPSFPSKDKYYQIFEYMFVFSKGKPKTFNPIEDRKNKWFGTGSFGTSTMRKTDGSIVQTDKKKTVKEFGVRFNIWNYNTGFGYTTKDKFAYDHPAMFPENLVYDHILSWTNEGDVVLDPYMGSGTVAKMSIITNRHYVGLELNKDDYKPIIDKRIEEAKNIDKEEFLSFIVKNNRANDETREESEENLQNHTEEMKGSIDDFL